MRWDLEEAIFNIVATYILTVSSEFHHFSRLTELEQNHVFPCASSTELKGLGADFVFGFVQSMDGERDPRNLLLAFQVAKTIIRRGYDLGESTHACGTFRVPTHSGRPGNLKAGFPSHGNWFKKTKYFGNNIAQIFFIVINSGLFEVTVGEEQFVRDYSGKTDCS